jgi:hypothetical protein
MIVKAMMIDQFLSGLVHFFPSISSAIVHTPIRPKKKRASDCNQMRDTQPIDQ